MKKIYLMSTLLVMTFVSAQTNLITNGTFDNNGSGWSTFTIKSDSSGSTSVTGGNAKFTSANPTGNNWDHYGIYQAVTLSPGTYVMDFDLSFSGIDDSWAELLFGSLQPQNNKDYKVGSTDANEVAALGLIEEVYNTWDCNNGIQNNPDITSTGATNNGSVELASTYIEQPAHIGGSCDTNATVGSLNFEITTAGIYYLVFKTGNWEGTYGSTGVTIDNVKLFNVNSLANDKFDDKTFSVYPNPVNDVVNFSMKEAVDSIVLYNLLGKEVFSRNVSSKEFSIDISSLSSGTYMAKMISNGKSESVKIVKK
jgi:Secretion system C-terminal sorting domain